MKIVGKDSGGLNNVICIDPSFRSSGIVYRRENKVYSTTIETFNWGLSRALHFIHREMLYIMNNYYVKVAFIESPSFNSKGNSIFQLSAVIGVILLALHDYRVPFMFIPNRSWRSIVFHNFGGIKLKYNKRVKVGKDFLHNFCFSEYKIKGFGSIDEIEAFFVMKAVDYALSNRYDDCSSAANLRVKLLEEPDLVKRW